MALLCPQRDALEEIFGIGTRAAWPLRLAKKLKGAATFLIDGERVHFLGVNNGAGMRRNPNLHIAVFGKYPPGEGWSGKQEDLLPDCRFGALLTGPRTDGLMVVEGVSLVSVKGAIVELRKNGMKTTYRETV